MKLATTLNELVSTEPRLEIEKTVGASVFSSAFHSLPHSVYLSLRQIGEDRGKVVFVDTLVRACSNDIKNNMYIMTECAFLTKKDLARYDGLP